MRKIKFLFSFTLLTLISVNIISQDITKYLIPTPKNIDIKKQGELTINSHIKSEKLTGLVKSINTINFVGKIKLLSFYYGLNSINFGIDSVNLKAQSYSIKIDSASITIIGQNDAALFYGKQTLLQVLDYAISENISLPCLQILYYPDFEKRGFMMDVSRDKVPTMATLYNLIDLLASWKINELQLYVEHTFAYKNHKEVWENSSPLTASEIQLLDKYCTDRFIDLVPNQNSFGHMENWLKHDKYLELAECPENCNTIWGPSKKASLDPTNPKSFELIQELYAELLPNFTSKYFNIGCDETMELGLGKSKSTCEKEGKGKVYLDYLIKLNDEANKQGKLTQFWGDIILNHPELIPELPKNMTAMVWGYDANTPFDKNLPKFKNAGIEFYVCPGTSAWNSLIGRNDNGFANLKNAAIQGKINGAKGFLNTNWGDYGHWQPLSVTYPTMLIGASYSWNYTESALDKLEFQLNHYVYMDKTGNTAKAILKLGLADLKTGIPNGNGNAFHLMLYRYKWTLEGNYQTKELTIKGLEDAEKEIIDALSILKNALPQSEDSIIIKAEIEQAANLAIHSIHLGIARLNSPDHSISKISAEEKAKLIAELEPLIKKHRELWITQNRVGGLDDSAGKLEEVLESYKK